MTRFCPNVCGEINVGPMQTEATAERSRRQGAPRVVSRLTMCYRKQLCGGGTLTGHLPYHLRTVQVSVPAVGKSRTCRRGRESWRRWAPDPEQLLEPTGRVSEAWKVVRHTNSCAQAHTCTRRHRTYTWAPLRLCTCVCTGGCAHICTCMHRFRAATQQTSGVSGPLGSQGGYGEVPRTSSALVRSHEGLVLRCDE